MSGYRKLNPPWTKEQTEELKVLWASALSASEIGLKLNKTRNAVIGKVQRLKLKPRNFRDFHRPKNHREQEPKYLILDELTELPTELHPLGVTIYNNTGCKYAFGDRPPYTYCGKPGIPWCEEHHQRVYARRQDNG